MASKRWWILGITSIGVFMSSLDLFIEEMIKTSRGSPTAPTRELEVQAVASRVN